MFLVEKKIFAVIFLLFGLFGGPVISVYAADFGLSASKNTYEVGETIPVKIYVSSPRQVANAVSGVVSFPNDKLQVSSLSKTSSVVNMWVQEPAYFNDDGQVNFEGVILNPGYTGSAGVVLTINFKARQTGTVKLNFSNGSILANDGVGTNILGKLGQLSLTIIPASTKPELAPLTLVPPRAPTKVSPTATTTSEIDNTPPEQLVIIQVESSNPKRARFSFSASDSSSGIDYYQLSLDNLIVSRLSRQTNVYETLDLAPGPHRLGIIVTDKAGNSVEETINFEINPVTLFGLSLSSFGGQENLFLSFWVSLVILLSLIIFFFGFKNWHRRPVVSTPRLYPENLSMLARIIFRGRAEKTQAVVLLRNGQIVAETKPGADNIFEFTLDNLPAGFQHFSLVAVEALGNPTLTQDYPVMLSAGASIVVSGIEVKRPHFPQTITPESCVENFMKKDINYPERNV